MDPNGSNCDQTYLNVIKLDHKWSNCTKLDFVIILDQFGSDQIIMDPNESNCGQTWSNLINSLSGVSYMDLAFLLPFHEQFLRGLEPVWSESYYPHISAFTVSWGFLKWIVLSSYPSMNSLSGVGTSAITGSYFPHTRPWTVNSRVSYLSLKLILLSSFPSINNQLKSFLPQS